MIFWMKRGVGDKTAAYRSSRTKPGAERGEEVWTTDL